MRMHRDEREGLISGSHPNNRDVLRFSNPRAENDSHRLVSPHPMVTFCSAWVHLRITSVSLARLANNIRRNLHT